MSAMERVQAWREQWVTLRGLDHERIHTANYATLLLSDIDALLAAADAYVERVISDTLDSLAAADTGCIGSDPALDPKDAA